MPEGIKTMVAVLQTGNHKVNDWDLCCAEVVLYQIIGG